MGDTDAFDASGPIRVTIIDDAGQSRCRFELHAVQDGTTLDWKDVPADSAPVVLDPQGSSPVYLADPFCTIRITNAS